jgi:hypothetical protein
MITNIFDQIGIVRRFKGGDWFKTKHRGWIDFDTFSDYLSYGFDPVAIKYVEYKNLLKIESRDARTEL